MAEVERIAAPNATPASNFLICSRPLKLPRSRGPWPLRVADCGAAGERQLYASAAAD